MKRGLYLSGFFLVLFIQCSKEYISYEEGILKPGATPGYLKGEIVDERTGRPIPGALITFLNTDLHPRYSVDKSGEFSIPLPPPTYRIRITASGYKPGGFRIEVPREGKSVRLLLRRRTKPIKEIEIVEEKKFESPKSARFRGEVIDAKNRLPIPGALIAFLDADINPLYTNGSGRFSLTVPFRTYKIRITARGYVSSEVEIDVSEEGGWIKFFLKKA